MVVKGRSSEDVVIVFFSAIAFVEEVFVSVPDLDVWKQRTK